MGSIKLKSKHRVLCGDSTKADDVARLMDGETAELCFTSPPYALGSSVALSGNRSMSERGNAYEGHDDTPDGWIDLMDGFWSSVESVADCLVVNVQPLAGNKRDLMRWIADRSERLVDVAVWNKMNGQPPMAAGVLTSVFEFILVFAGPGASRRIPFSSWRGNVGSIYSGSPQRLNEYASIHAATMPLHLAGWVLGTLCDKSRSVLDPFLGTGTTLIAAEQLGRKCYGLEISPAYCDVIVNRWQKLTGERAVNEKTGDLFPVAEA